jgi:hypothetical protein
MADAVIEQLNGKEFGGNSLRIEVSERRDSSSGSAGRGGASSNAATPTAARKAVNKVVHADSIDTGAPDPRWAGELAKLKGLLDNQKAAV